MKTSENLNFVDKNQYVAWLRKLSEVQLGQEENNMLMHLEAKLPSVSTVESKLHFVREELSNRTQNR
jgi:hypothetical protein